MGRRRGRRGLVRRSPARCGHGEAGQGDHGTRRETVRVGDGVTVVMPGQIMNVIDGFGDGNGIQAASVKLKRKRKMAKHKHRKRRKRGIATKGNRN